MTDFICLVAIWYSTAMVTITTSKMILTRLAFPYIVCCCQFGIAALCGNIYLRMSNMSGLDIPSLCSWGWKHVSGAMGLHVTPDAEKEKTGTERRNQFLKIALCYTFGFLLTNQAFSISSVSFAETIKSSEPVFVVLLNIIMYNIWPPVDSLLALLLICVGVGTSCLGDYNFVFTAFVCATTSNLCFGGRAVLSKQYFKTLPIDSKGKLEQFAGLKLFTKVSEVGFFVMLPLAVVTEGAMLHTALYGVASPDTASSVILPSTVMVCLMLMIVNGLSYACYNLMSFIVLGRTDVVTHAALNIFRRVVIIISTSFIFGVQLSVLNYIGVFVALVGGMLYARSKSMSKA